MKASRQSLVKPLVPFLVATSPRLVTGDRFRLSRSARWFLAVWRSEFFYPLKWIVVKNHALWNHHSKKKRCRTGTLKSGSRNNQATWPGDQGCTPSQGEKKTESSSFSWSVWWFQLFYIFPPIWGRFQFSLIFFNWVETTKQWLIAFQKKKLPLVLLHPNPMSFASQNDVPPFHHVLTAQGLKQQNNPTDWLISEVHVHETSLLICLET